MNNQELLLNKVEKDWETYKNRELTKSKEDILYNSYSNMVALDCMEYLSNQADNSIESWENAEEIYKILLAMPNIIEKFAEYLFHSDYGEAISYCVDGGFTNFVDNECYIKLK